MADINQLETEVPEGIVVKCEPWEVCEDEEYNTLQAFEFVEVKEEIEDTTELPQKDGVVEQNPSQSSRLVQLNENDQSTAVMETVMSRGFPDMAKDIETVHSPSEHVVNSLLLKALQQKLKCSVCSEVFMSKDRLISHEMCHIGKEPLKCKVKDKPLGNFLNLHQERLDNYNGGTSFECDICGNTYSFKSALRRHKRTHTGEKPFKCDICDMAFSQSSSLQSHRYTHTGEKPFKCDICDKSFNRRNILVTHKRTHIGDKPFKCDICGNSYSARSGIYKHKLSHTGERRFKCDICDKLFTQNSSLKRHMKIHIESDTE